MPKALKKFQFPFFFLLISGIVSYFIATHIGLFDLPDGFFYFVLGDFLLYGRLFSVNPFNVSVPQTLYGPVYSIFLAFIIRQMPELAMTLIPLFQLVLVSISALFVFYMTKLLIGKNWALLSVAVFFNLPFLLIYATSLMSEAVTLFIFTVFTFFLILLFRRKTLLPPSLLVFIACLLTLTKNAYVPLILLSIVFWIFFLLRDRKKLTLLSGYVMQIPAILGILGILLWIRFNKTHHDIYALTNYTGRHLYNNVVNSGRLLPDPETPIFQEFLTRIGNTNDFFVPEYMIQRYFTKEFYEKNITEAEMDKKFLALSVAAIQRHPLSYIKHALVVSWNDVTTVPYSGKILTTLKEDGCRFSWDSSMCKQQIYNPGALTLWAFVLQFHTALYPWGTTLLFLIAVTGMVDAILSKKVEIVILGGLFFLFLFIQGAAQAADGRYIIPLYSVYTICIINGIRTIVSIPQKRRALVNV